MSAQGIFILDGMDSRPKSKKQLKELVAAGRLDMIALEQVSMFGEQFTGVLTKEALEEHGDITFVGPSPYSKRDFFGKFFINKKGEVSVS
jgi:hypothetical protein